MGLSIASRNYAIISLILRIVIAALLVLSIVLVVANTVHTDDGKTKFNDIIGFRYLVAVNAIVLAYSILQLGPAIYILVKGKLLLPYPLDMYLNFGSDQVLAYLSLSGASAGLAAAIDVKRLIDPLLEVYDYFEDDNTRNKFHRFFSNAEISASLTLLAALLMMVLSVIADRFLFRNKEIKGAKSSSHGEAQPKEPVSTTMVSDQQREPVEGDERVIPTLESELPQP